MLFAGVFTLLPTSVVRITIHVLELVVAAILILLYLLVKLWRRI